MCVCVCVCVRARVCVCVGVCMWYLVAYPNVPSLCFNPPLLPFHLSPLPPAPPSDNTLVLFSNVRLAHIILFALSWVLAFIFIFFMFRPFISGATAETRQVAELLSQLPSEMDVEGLVAQVGGRGCLGPGDTGGREGMSGAWWHRWGGGDVWGLVAQVGERGCPGPGGADGGEGMLRTWWHRWGGGDVRGLVPRLWGLRRGRGGQEWGLSARWHWCRGGVVSTLLIPKTATSPTTLIPKTATSPTTLSLKLLLALLPLSLKLLLARPPQWQSAVEYIGCFPPSLATTPSHHP